MRLNSLISVAPRHTRSINLERDAESTEALRGYVLTTTAKSCLERILSCLDDPKGQRAWTLTGPYGSGKSAFVLYLANVLSLRGGRGRAHAERITEEQAPISFLHYLKGRTSKGYCVIRISGSQESLIGRFLESSCRDFSALAKQKPATRQLWHELEQLRLDARGGEHIRPIDVVDKVCQLSQQLTELKLAQGTLIVVDELGKFLDFAAKTPQADDVFLLQQLAEASTPDCKKHLAVITVLHQAFDRYALGLRAAVRAEWAKVQGRFEDIAFQEPPDQLLSLIAASIRHDPHSPAFHPIKARIRKMGRSLFQLGFAPRPMKEGDFLRTLEACAPLHPLTALVLSRLCRKLGQNQRSLFSFLVSREPHGFADFLSQESPAADLPLYEPSRLFDYISESLGDALSVGEAGARWAAAQTALDRAFDSTPSEMAVLKTVGLLNALGTGGHLLPTPTLLRSTFEIKSNADFPALRGLLSRSLLVERRFNGTVGLWDGSDLDLESRLQEAGQRLPETSGLAATLAAILTPRPLVAKRHSYQVGTIRYFSVTFSDLRGLDLPLTVPPGADGLLVYYLSADDAETETLETCCLEASVATPQVVFAVPKDIRALRDAIRQQELLQWVASNTPELQADAVARKELRSRLSSASALLSTEIQNLFDPGQKGGMSISWFHDGSSVEVQSPRGLSELLSRAADRVYHQSAVIRNELLNRRHLSSAAAAARRNLISAMIRNQKARRLGIEGNPPELSMYRSMLEVTGIHRGDTEAGYHFGPPTENHSLGFAWKLIEDVLEQASTKRVCVADIYEELQKPPFGFKAGPLPVLIWAYLLANPSELALYEDNIFTPELSEETVERMLRSPHKFEVRRYRVSGNRRNVLRGIGELLNSQQRDEDPDLIELMRPLYRVYHRLPAYTRQTRGLNPTAAAVRQALSDAREPDILLYSDLPLACGTQPFTGDDTVVQDHIPFLNALRSALKELAETYHNLLAELTQLIFQALDVSGPAARTHLRLQGAEVFRHSSEPRLRAFSHILEDDTQEVQSWTESLAAMIIGKIPKAWTDNDRAKFDVALGELARSFRNTLLLVRERFAPEHRLASDVDVFRLSVLNLGIGETAEVVSVLPHERGEWKRAVLELNETLNGFASLNNPKVVAAALAVVLREYMQKLKLESSATVRSSLLVEDSR